jgi:hypothetical protein
VHPRTGMRGDLANDEPTRPSKTFQGSWLLKASANMLRIGSSNRRTTTSTLEKSLAAFFSELPNESLRQEWVGRGSFRMLRGMKVPRMAQ